MSWDQDVSHLRRSRLLTLFTQPARKRRAGLTCDAPTALRSSAQLVGEASLAVTKRRPLGGTRDANGAPAAALHMGRAERAVL